MSRIGTFFFGTVCGAVLCYTALKYHVVRTDDGFQFVPKLTANFSETYVDVRHYKLADWQQHKGLVAAIVHSGKSGLFGESSMDSLRSEAENVLSSLGFRNAN